MGGGRKGRGLAYRLIIATIFIAARAAGARAPRRFSVVLCYSLASVSLRAHGIYPFPARSRTCIRRRNHDCSPPLWIPSPKPFPSDLFFGIFTLAGRRLGACGRTLPPRFPPYNCTRCQPPLTRRAGAPPPPPSLSLSASVLPLITRAPRRGWLAPTLSYPTHPFQPRSPHQITSYLNLTFAMHLKHLRCT